MFAIIIVLLIVVLILVLAADIVVQPPPPPVQESANRTRETTIIVAGERVWFPIDGYSVQQQEVMGRTAYASDGVWYYRGAGGQADNGSYCCYLLIPREETNHCGREEMVSSLKYTVPKNCVTC